METKFIIPAVNKTSIENHINKLNKRAIRIGIDPIILEWGKAFLDRRQIVVPNLNISEGNEEIFDEEILSVPLEVKGQLDILHNDWQFIACLQHLSTGESVIRNVTQNIKVPIYYRTCGTICEHCNTKRFRKDTYVMYHKVSDTFCVVGSLCIRDFLGDNTPENIINRANFVAELFTFLEGSKKISNYRSGYGIDMDELIHINYFLAHTVAQIRVHGWLSKSSAKESGGIPTADLVQDRIYNGKNFLGDDMEEAIKASEWAENLSDDVCDDSDYLFNIRAISRTGMVGVRTFGFSASIIPAYRKSTVKVEQSKHVGSVKQRANFKLKLVKRLTFDSMYGVQNKYIFNDNDGNVLTWITSSDQFMSEGNQYNIVGTIKRHIEYKGTPQTELTRCKVLD